MKSILPQLPIDANVVCSPLSVRLALAMLVPGARGGTRRQLERFVGTGEPADLLGRLNTLRTDPVGAIRLSVENGVFLRPDVPVLPRYREAIEGPFRAQVENLELGNPSAAAARVNEWIGKATEGMISNFLPPEIIQQLTGLILVNAIYFLAEWEDPFEEHRTEPERFHPLNGAAYDVPMMRQTCFLPYAKTHSLQAVRIPYKTTSLVVVLPRRGRFEEVARSFGEDRVPALANRYMSRRELALRLPRFDVESRLHLVDVLRRLGVRLPFEESADFADLTDHPDGLFVEAVEHGARIHVDEKGTEAAASTAVLMSLGVAVNPPEPLQFHVDRPFLFFVYDDESESVLFAGRCTSP
jgi:serpin B